MRVQAVGAQHDQGLDPLGAHPDPHQGGAVARTPRTAERVTALAEGLEQVRVRIGPVAPGVAPGPYR